MRARRRGGVSEMIGALFVLALLVVASGYGMVIFDSFQSYQAAVDQRAAFNAQQAAERPGIGKVLFGGSQQYAPVTPALPYTMSPTSGADVYPIGNMNFTTSDAGWAFNVAYVSGATGGSGGFATKAMGSPSGPGEVFANLTGTGFFATTHVVMNWTTSFSLDQNEYSALTNALSTLELSWGRRVVVFGSTFGGTGTSTIEVVVENGNTHAQAVLATLAPTYGTPDASWVQTNGVSMTSAQKSAVFTGAGTYYLIVTANVSLTNDFGTSTFSVYYDDLGLVLFLATYSEANVCAVFSVSQSVPSITGIVFDFTSVYTEVVSQTIYAWDFALSSLVQLDQATIGGTSTTRGANVTALGYAPSGLVQTGSAVISVPGCGDVSTAPGEVVARVASSAFTTYTGTLGPASMTVFYSDTSKVTLILQDEGPSLVHFVSLWVSGPSGTKHFASTIAGADRFDAWVAPSGSVSVAVLYAWTPGSYTFTLVTSMGNLVSVSATAP
ncbi:MAG: hypothetical protein JRN46_02330 [Nitrososphaerota archaeon]|nr:hypothetical protein [Nitrososphaerota archaeon]